MFPEVSTQCEWGQGRNRRHLGDSIAAGLASGWPWGHSRPPHTRRRQHREPRRGRGRGHPQRRTISSEVILRAHFHRLPQLRSEGMHQRACLSPDPSPQLPQSRLHVRSATWLPKPSTLFLRAVESSSAGGRSTRPSRPSLFALLLLEPRHQLLCQKWAQTKAVGCQQNPESGRPQITYMPSLVTIL